MQACCFWMKNISERGEKYCLAPLLVKASEINSRLAWSCEICVYSTWFISQEFLDAKKFYVLYKLQII